MKVNKYRILKDCISKGIEWGYYRAHKHTDTPTEDAVIMAIEDAVMNEICEYFNFEEEAVE